MGINSGFNFLSSNHSVREVLLDNDAIQHEVGAKKWPRRFSASAIKPLRIRFPEIYSKVTWNHFTKAFNLNNPWKGGVVDSGSCESTSNGPNNTPFGVLVNKKIRDL